MPKSYYLISCEELLALASGICERGGRLTWQVACIGACCLTGDSTPFPLASYPA